MLVALFVTCLSDTLYPRTGQSVVTLLRRPGLGRPGFPPSWLPGPGATMWLPADPALSVGDLDRCGAALTMAALGIAVTGTIVLDAGAGQGRVHGPRTLHVIFAEGDTG